MRPVLATDAPVAQFLSPAVTASKIDRIRRLAKDPNPKIRESAASSNHAPDEVYEALSRDADPGVRACIAKNELVSCDILRRLATDPDERVRGFVAINYVVPDDAMHRLGNDPSPIVRGLVEWKARLAAEAHEHHLIGSANGP